MLVALPGLDGTTVYVEPANVATLTAVPANALPPSVPAGTYVNDCDSTGRVGVVGTPAAVAALLAGGGGGAGGSIIARGFVDGATGAVTMLSGPVATGVRTGAGDYTVTFTDPTVVPADASIGCLLTESGIIAQDGPIGGGSFGVDTFDEAGVAEDHGFTWVLFGTPA